MPLIASSPDTDSTPVDARLSVAEAMPLLDAPDAADRRRAALALDGCAEAHLSMAERLLEETDAAVRSALLSGLSDTENPEVVDLLITILRGEDASQRSEVVGLLQHRGALVASRIKDMLVDDDPDLRIMAIDILRLLPHEDAPIWLRDHLERETHPNVVGVAVDRLAEIGSAADLPVLRDVAQRFAADPYLSFATDLVIKRIETLSAEGSG